MPITNLLIFKVNSIFLHEFLLKLLTDNPFHTIILSARGKLMRMNDTLNQLKMSFIPGHVYRRSELKRLSSNIDRHLAALVAHGYLEKLSTGLYSAPRTTSFGPAPVDIHAVLQCFLKDDHFVFYGLGEFNSLGLGTTQMYNHLIVFNRKRTGNFNLGGHQFTFYRWREAPKHLTEEFLVIELLNRLEELSEDREVILLRLKNKIKNFNQKKLLYASAHYGTLSTQKKLNSLMKEELLEKQL